MSKTLIHNATIVNQGVTQHGSVLIDGDRIAKVLYHNSSEKPELEAETYIDAGGLLLIPGCIDDQVHFRDPGLTHKGDMQSESRAAVAGGITSFMDMPNTIPQTTTIEDIENKFKRAGEVSLANHSFFIGGTNSNLDELRNADYSKVCGVKLFLGSSTGNMLVDNPKTLEGILKEVDAIIAVHAESEEVINSNKAKYIKQFGDNLPIMFHPLIRSSEACYQSSSKIVELAKKHNSRLHILHISTAKELSLLEGQSPEDKKITAEVCVHHLYFDDNDYAAYGNRIKWNPAIKSYADREALINAVNSNLIDIVATDHAPHLPSEKEGNIFSAASGGPLVQHSLLTMLELSKKGKFTLEKVVDKMAHIPAKLFNIVDRGFIKEGYFADLVLVDPNTPYTVTPKNILSKCGWSPFNGHKFPHTISKTIVNGVMVYNNGVIESSTMGRPLEFKR